MGELLTSAGMREAEAAAIAAGMVTGQELMERAGRGVVDAVFNTWPGLRATSHRALVLCGPGNNGGDGFVIARVLKDWGWQVETVMLGDVASQPADARANLARWVGAGGDVHRLDNDPGDAPNPRPQALTRLLSSDGDGVIVDALFGTGLTRPLTPSVWASVDLLVGGGSAASWPRVAVDVPSGLCADSGRVLLADDGQSGLLRADLTVTFHRLKPGHVLAEGPDLCGRVALCDIGLPRARAAQSKGGERMAERGGDRDAGRGGVNGIVAAGVADKGTVSHAHRLVLADPLRPDAGVVQKRLGHKYAHGHALILAGGPGEGGAARLSARGALRIGAGLVTVACPMSALSENSARLDTIMLRPLHDGAALKRLLEDRQYNALCLGPGMGHERARALVPVALESGRRVVLDADALSAYGGDPQTLFARLHDLCILTPHGGEFARLFPDLAARLTQTGLAGPAFSKVDATREAARRAGCVVLFKGADTVIAAPDGDCAISAAHYERSAPWLATAGSGDVLSGFIAGLLARGLGTMQAAQTAAWLHVECARAFGPGLIAEDLPEQLPGVFRALGL